MDKKFILTGLGYAILGLFLYYGRFVSMETIDPVLAASSVAVLIGMIFMKVLFIQSMRNA